MYSDILTRLLTVADAEKLRQEIALLKPALYSTKPGAFEDALHSGTRAWVATAIEEACQKETMDKDTFLTQLEKELEALPTLQMIFAFEPSLATLEKISQWVEAQTQKHMLLDVAYDPRILGGLILIKDGIYKDFSFRKNILSAVTTAVQEKLGINTTL